MGQKQMQNLQNLFILPLSSFPLLPPWLNRHLCLSAPDFHFQHFIFFFYFFLVFTFRRNELKFLVVRSRCSLSLSLLLPLFRIWHEERRKEKEHKLRKWVFCSVNNIILEDWFPYLMILSSAVCSFRRINVG